MKVSDVLCRSDAGQNLKTLAWAYSIELFQASWPRTTPRTRRIWRAESARNSDKEIYRKCEGGERGHGGGLLGAVNRLGSSSFGIFGWKFSLDGTWFSDESLEEFRGVCALHFLVFPVERVDVETWLVYFPVDVRGTEVASERRTAGCVVGRLVPLVATMAARRRGFSSCLSEIRWDYSRPRASLGKQERVKSVKKSKWLSCDGMFDSMSDVTGPEENRCRKSDRGPAGLGATSPSQTK